MRTIAHILEFWAGLALGYLIFKFLLAFWEDYTEKHKEKFDSMEPRKCKRTFNCIYVGSFFVALIVGMMIPIVIIEPLLG